jgi:hypothetical protein
MRGVGIPTFARPGDCVPSRWGIRGDSGTRPPRWRLQERNGPKGKERTCRWRCGRTKSSDRRQGCAPGLPAVTLIRAIDLMPAKLRMQRGRPSLSPLGDPISCQQAGGALQAQFSADKWYMGYPALSRLACCHLPLPLRTDGIVSP